MDNDKQVREAEKIVFGIAETIGWRCTCAILTGSLIAALDSTGEDPIHCLLRLRKRSVELLARNN